MHRAVFAIAVAIALAAAACQSNKTLAVFDLQDQSGQLTDDQRAQLSEHLAGALGQGGKQRVLPRARTQGLCPALAPDCLAQQAATLEAGGYATARVLQHGPRCSLVLKFYRRADKAARFSTAVQSACDPVGLVTAIDLAALRLLTPDNQASQYEAEAAMRELRQREEAERRRMEMRKAEEEAMRAAEDARKRAEEAKRLADQAAQDMLEAPADPPAEDPLAIAPPQGIPVALADTGRVLVNAKPPAKVFANGRQLGQTPLTVNLPPGRHRLVLEGPDGQRMNREVVVKAGEDLRLVVQLPSGQKKLERSQIMKIFKRHRRQLMECLKLQPKLSEAGPMRLNLKLTIQSTGKVSQAQVSPEEAFGPVRSCVEKKARRWKFPSFEEEPVKVNFPIIMKH